MFYLESPFRERHLKALSFLSENSGGVLVKPAKQKIKTKGWVTIGGHPEGDKQHADGTAVYIDGHGEIKKGPKELKGQRVNDIKNPEVKPSPLLVFGNKPDRLRNGRQSGVLNDIDD